jgi:RNA polymerase subunit RPABC4/transcription elongation factor Spt4
MVEEQIQERKVKGLDEIFCRTCGAIIKKQAEICPHCGVRNLPSTTSYTKRHDPNLHPTSVSENWYYGVIISTILWIFVVLFSSSVSEGSPLNTLLGLVIFLAWIGLPLSIYYDIQYVRANNDKWNPETVFWVIGGFIWLVNFVVVLVYLIRRKESMTCIQ